MEMTTAAWSLLALLDCIGGPFLPPDPETSGWAEFEQLRSNGFVESTGKACTVTGRGRAAVARRYRVSRWTRYPGRAFNMALQSKDGALAASTAEAVLSRIFKRI